MKFSIFVALILATVFSFLTTVYSAKTTIVKHTEAPDSNTNGFWKKQTILKPRWVKYWRPTMIYVPLWKKVWGPLIQNEWVPLPNAPLGRRESNDVDRTQFREVDYS